LLEKPELSADFVKQQAAIELKLAKVLFAGWIWVELVKINSRHDFRREVETIDFDRKKHSPDIPKNYLLNLLL
jgi:hypothetical protein